MILSMEQTIEHLITECTIVCCIHIIFILCTEKEASREHSRDFFGLSDLKWECRCFTIVEDWIHNPMHVETKKNQTYISFYDHAESLCNTCPRRTPPRESLHLLSSCSATPPPRTQTTSQTRKSSRMKVRLIAIKWIFIVRRTWFKWHILHVCSPHSHGSLLRFVLAEHNKCERSNHTSSSEIVKDTELYEVRLPYCNVAGPIPVVINLWCTKGQTCDVSHQMEAVGNIWSWSPPSLPRFGTSNYVCGTPVCTFVQPPVTRAAGSINFTNLYALRLTVLATRTILPPFKFALRLVNTIGCAIAWPDKWTPELQHPFSSNPGRGTYEYPSAATRLPRNWLRCDRRIKPLSLNSLCSPLIPIRKFL